MFKRQKSDRNITPPNAPSLEEVLSDIETFQVDVEKCNNMAATELLINSTEGWWRIFEQFIGDLKCLETVSSEIGGAKIKLESLKLEIDTDAEHLKDEVEHHQKLIEQALE